MSRCKAYFCRGFVDFDVDGRGELCPKCMQSIIPDLNERIAKKIQQKLDKCIQESINIDNMECDDE